MEDTRLYQDLVIEVHFRSHALYLLSIPKVKTTSLSDLEWVGFCGIVLERALVKSGSPYHKSIQWFYR